MTEVMKETSTIVAAQQPVKLMRAPSTRRKSTIKHMTALTQSYSMVHNKEAYWCLQRSKTICHGTIGLEGKDRLQEK